jgi:hypothetical protein
MMRAIATAIVFSLAFAATAPISHSESATNPSVRLIIEPAPSNLDDVRAVVSEFAKQEGFTLSEGKLPNLESRRGFLMINLERDSLSIIVMNGGRETAYLCSFIETNPMPPFRK